MTPKSAAALVEAAPPSGLKTCSDPIGASSAGILSFCPRNVVDGSTLETSFSTRGRNATWSNANLFRRMVVSDSEAPTR